MNSALYFQRFLIYKIKSVAMGKMHFFSAFKTNLDYIWCKFSIMIKRIYARTAHFYGDIWDKFSE